MKKFKKPKKPKKPEFVCPPERKKKCGAALWNCITKSKVSEAKCFAAASLCTSTNLPVLFPHGEHVK